MAALCDGGDRLGNGGFGQFKVRFGQGE